MGCYAETYGTIEVKDCPKVWEILKRLKEVVNLEGEASVEIGKKEGNPSVLVVDVRSAGYSSYSHATDIDDIIGELGPYAERGARFNSPCEDDHDGYFYVGSEEQKTQAVSEYALERIEEYARDLLPDEATKAIQVIRDGVNRDNLASSES